MELYDSINGKTWNCMESHVALNSGKHMALYLDVHSDETLGKNSLMKQQRRFGSTFLLRLHYQNFP